MYYLLVFLMFFLAGCHSKESPTTKKNLKAEYIYRHSNEIFFTPPLPKPQKRKLYPWDDRYIGDLPRITKEFFRCKGNPLNPTLILEKAGKEPQKYFDCEGGKMHGLPLREKEQFIYPCLLEILNYIQQKTAHRVIVTSGHRCPKHNLYVDPSPTNWNSKHTLGAEVDFYVEGMENEPISVISLIQNYYTETPPFSRDTEFTLFQRYETETISILPWHNKEVFIKLYSAEEGRNCDNQHPFPYINVQVRYDRTLNSKVAYNQKQAQNYLRH